MSDSTAAGGYIVAGSGGKTPWSGRKVFWLAGVPLVGGLLAISTPLAVRHVEGQLTSDARRDLVAAGVTDVIVDFDYRNGTASGVLPGALSAGEAAEIVDHRLLRDFEFIVNTAAATPTTAVPTTTAQTTSPPTTGAPTTAAPATSAPTTTAPTTTTTTEAAAVPVDAEFLATIADGRVAITGTVASEEQRSQVLDAAVAAFGADAVVDELTVDESGPASERSERDLMVGVAALEAMNGVTSGSVQLNASGVTVSALVDSQATFEGLNGLAATFPDTDTSVDIEASDALVEEQRVALQAEIEALSAEIRTNVTFDSGSAEVGDAGRVTLDKVAAAMTRYRLPVVAVDGHADSRGSAELNRALAMARAGAVEAHLVGAGIAPERLRATGAGESQPIAANTNQAGRELNRRVEFTALATF